MRECNHFVHLKYVQRTSGYFSHLTKLQFSSLRGSSPQNHKGKYTYQMLRTHRFQTLGSINKKREWKKKVHDSCHYNSENTETYQWDLSTNVHSLFSAVKHWGLILQQMKIIHLRQRPFIHIECFIKKEVITVYFIHNYLWGYKPINREHFVFLTSMLTSQCKEKTRGGQRGW